jgi:hypothetical protein
MRRVIFLTGKRKNRHNLNGIKEYIEQILFLNQIEWNALISLFREEKLLKGDFFALEGRKETKIGFLQKGVIRAFYRTKEGAEYNKTFFIDNEFFGAYASLVTNTKKSNQYSSLNGLHCINCRLFSYY